MQEDFFKTYQEAVDREFSGILRECEQYTHADHRYELQSLCEEVRTATAGAFVRFFDSLEEAENGATGLDGDFFASLGDAAKSAALPRLKQVIIDQIQEEFFYA